MAQAPLQLRCEAETLNIQRPIKSEPQYFAPVISGIEGWTLGVGRWTFAATMSRLSLTSPLTFTPIFMERIWGGRRLESEFGKKLPADKRIGESWEISDRPAAQSVVANEPLRGKTLHELWTEHQPDIFGDVQAGPRFPLLIKLLDAQDKLSLQVHPPADVAERFGGEPKTEFWYVARAQPGAELYVGLRDKISVEEFRRALDNGSAAGHLHSIAVKAGDGMFLPSGRFHAIGSGNLLVEVQQNSDTTYRVYDWDRKDDFGQSRQLHVEQALASIDFADVRPTLVRPQGEVLVRHQLFEVQKWELSTPREVVPNGQFAIVSCLTGSVACADVQIRAGEFMLVPVCLRDPAVKPLRGGTSILRVTIPR